MTIEPPPTQLQAPAGHSATRSLLPNLLLTLPFLALFFVQLYHHQLWRDELNVWGIDRASPTLSKLAYYIHYEGHPGLWYYLLWFPSRIWVSPSAMKAVEALIVTGIYLLIGLASPWSRLEKILVFLGYFISFEYTVLSRTYGLCLLFALAYVCVRTRRPQAVSACAVLLGLMANTDIIGVILSGTLLLEYSWDRLAHSRASHASPRVHPWSSLATLWSIYVAMVVVSYLTLHTAKDISWTTTGRFGSSLRDPHHLALALLSNLGLPWFPFSLHFPHKFWNPNPVLHPLFFAAVSVLAAAALIAIFRKSPPLLMLVGLTMLGSILFSHLVYLGYMRHFGIVFLAFLLAYWILRAQRPVPSRAALILLGISALAGLEAAAASWHHPFSNAGNAADWLVEHHLEDRPMAGFPDMMSAGIAEILNKPIYFPQCNCTDTFMLFSNRRDDMDETHLAPRLQRADHDMHTRQYTLITVKPLTPQQTAGIVANHQSVTPLAQFTDAEEQWENFYLYNVASTP